MPSPQRPGATATVLRWARPGIAGPAPRSPSAGERIAEPTTPPASSATKPNAPSVVDADAMSSGSTGTSAPLRARLAASHSAAMASRSSTVADR